MSKLFKLEPPVMVGSSAVTLLRVENYSNGRIAVQLYSVISEEDGGDGTAVEPYDSLSVNLPDQRLADAESFFARDYSYHAKTHSAMLEAGIIETVPGIGNVGGHGFCTAAKLTAKATAIPYEP